MIFYFSGTGNSLYAAKKLIRDDEKLINIADAINNNIFTYELSADEALGFVFPVYFYTVPKIVSDFIDKLEVTNVNYVYAVITCGGSINQAGSVLKKKLKARNIDLSYISELLMPDNSMLFYQIPPREMAKDRIDKADDKLEKIKFQIESKTKKDISDKTFISDLMGKMYKACQKTKKFYAEKDKCIGCGLCERNCPESVINLENSLPVWTKEECSKCSSCINRCPREAIQYGKHTKKRNRYYL